MSSSLLPSPTRESVVRQPAFIRPGKRRTEHALEAWAGHDPTQTDIRYMVISYGVLAPNPHNAQPWKIELTGPDRFDLYVDQSRLLPEADPPARQVHIGLGAFLENVELAARHFGYRTNIDYFPHGMYGNTTVEDKPAASVTLVKDITVQFDPLFDQILKRQTNRRTYLRKPLTEEQTGQLMAAHDSREYPLTITTDKRLMKALTEVMVDAMRIETASRPRDLEMVSAKSAAAFGWIVSTKNTRLDQVKVGRAYERISLTAAALGLAQHPMSQVEQEYPEMAPLRQRFAQLLDIPPGHKVQMVFRIGNAVRVTCSPRRAIASLLRTA